MRKPKVTIEQYDDRGDPEPPNNFRVEIDIDGELFFPDPRERPLLLGCEPLAKAEKRAAKVAKALGVEVTQ
jgi:hypothetical protein